MKRKIITIVFGLAAVGVAIAAAAYRPTKTGAYYSSDGTGHDGTWLPMAGSGGIGTPTGRVNAAGLYYSSDGTGHDGTWLPCPISCFAGTSGDTITSPNSTLTVGGTSSATTLDINLGQVNSWSGAQTFQKGFDITGTGATFATSSLGIDESSPGAARLATVGPSATVGTIVLVGYSSNFATVHTGLYMDSTGFTEVGNVPGRGFDVLGNMTATTVNLPVARKGTFVCTGAGTITIANTNELATSDVVISLNAQGGAISTAPAMKTVTGGTGFTVLCGAADTSTYNYDILN